MSEALIPDAGAIEEKRKKVKRKKISKDKVPVVKLVDSLGRNRKQSDPINGDAEEDDVAVEKFDVKRKKKGSKKFCGKRQKKNSVASNGSLDISNNLDGIPFESHDFRQGIVKVSWKRPHEFKIHFSI